MVISLSILHGGPESLSNQYANPIGFSPILERHLSDSFYSLHRTLGVCQIFVEILGSLSNLYNGTWESLYFLSGPLGVLLFPQGPQESLVSVWALKSFSNLNLGPSESL